MVLLQSRPKHVVFYNVKWLGLNISLYRVSYCLSIHKTAQRYLLRMLLDMIYQLHGHWLQREVIYPTLYCNDVLLNILAIDSWSSIRSEAVRKMDTLKLWLIDYLPQIL